MPRYPSYRRQFHFSGLGYPEYRSPAAKPGNYWHHYEARTEHGCFNSKYNFTVFLIFFPRTLNTLTLLTPNTPDTLYPEVATSKFDIKQDLLLASWPDFVLAESAVFYDSILLLFRQIKENKIKKLLLDSGTPDGGILTEEVIAFVEQEVCLYCPLQKVALLESSDYHWDNNMVQFINYLILSRGLEVQFQMFLTREAAIKWLKE